MSPQVTSEKSTAKKSAAKKLIAGTVIPVPADGETASPALIKAKMAKTAKTVKNAKTTKKSVKTAKTVKSDKAPRAKKEGLRKPQIALLKFLAKAKKAFTRSILAEKAEVDVAGCCEWLGAVSEEKRLANDVKHFPSLISLGLVRFAPEEEVNGRAVPTYQITAKGTAAAAKL
jgi:hypothetical protein